MPTKTEYFGQFIAALAREGIPDDVLETARFAVAHNLAVAAAGGRLAETALRWSAGRWGGSGARAFLSGAELSPPDAAFVNACLIHARAQDDTYFPGLTHVGSATIPAVLALAEAEGRTIGDVIAGVVAGYEVAGAISRAAARQTTAYGFRGSGIYGVFGAAAGTAHLLKLDADQCANAIGIAASMAAGTNQTWVDGSSEWQLQLGSASRSGLEAALLASTGATGSRRALEGTSGFFAAFARDEAVAADVGSELGTSWATREVTFKAYPVCAILQSPVSAAASLTRSAGVPFVSAKLTLPSAEADYPGTDGMPPFDDPGAALMSARYCLGTALTRGTVTVDDLLASGEERSRKAAGRVQLLADDKMGPREFVLDVEWSNGRSDHVVGDGALKSWNRADMDANLNRLQAEVREGIDLLTLIDRVFGPLDLPAADLVDAVVGR